MVNVVEVVVRTTDDTAKGLDSAKSSFSKAGSQIAGSLKPVGIAMAGSGLLAMASPLAAGGIAMAAFGAVAAPTLSKVEKALTTTGAAGKKAWADLDPSQRALATSIKGLQSSFDGVAKSMEPMVTRVLGLGVTIAKDLMPSLSILGKAGGQAFTAILTPIDALVKSSGFNTFVQQMASFAKQAAPLIGTLLVGALRILMQLLEQLAPVGLQLMKTLTPILLDAFSSAIPIVKFLAAALEAILKPLGRFAPILGPLALGIYAMIKAVQLARGVWLALNVVLDVNPFIAISVAVVAIALLVIKYHNQIWSFIVSTWNNVRKFVTGIWNDILAFAKSWWPLLLGPSGVVVKYHAQIWSYIQSIWNTIYGFIKRIWNDILGFVRSVLGSVTSTIRGAMSTVYNVMINGWNNVYHGSLSVLNSLISWVRGLPGRFTGALGSLAGGLYSIGKTALNQLWNGLKASAGGVVGWLGGFAKSVISTFKKIWGWFSPSSVMYEGGKSLMTGLAGGIKDHAKLAQNQAQFSAQAMIGGVVGGGVSRWTSTILKALKMVGLPASLLGDVEVQMRSESGGNVMAQNNTDINAQMGTPSKGLMQVIQPTFDYWHVPGTSWNIFDPLANIAAALNYGKHGKGFGTGMGQIGSGHGYSAGGATSAGWASVGEHGRELVKLPGGATVYPHSGAAGPAGGATTLVLQIQAGGQSDFDKVMIKWLKEKSRVLGGGSVQTAFGKG